jgi:hemerythrin-like metal-binding protein
MIANTSESAGSTNDMSELAVCWLATGQLPPALVTGNQLIDSEHCFLISALADLGKVCVDQASVKDCSACGLVRQRCCEELVVDMLGDLIAFVLDHFRTEEALMRDSLLLMVDRFACEAHMEDHAAISARVLEIVSSLDPLRIVSRIRELNGVLSCWTVNHIARHDQFLLPWISREDSMHKSA